MEGDEESEIWEDGGGGVDDRRGAARCIHHLRGLRDTQECFWGLLGCCQVVAVAVVRPFRCAGVRCTNEWCFGRHSFSYRV